MKTKFDLIQMLTTVFRPQPQERIGIFIDLDNPMDIRGLKFLKNPKLETQQIAYGIFYADLLEKKAALGLASCEFYAYEPTGGSNLELPPTVVNLSGETLNLVDDVLSHLNIVLYFSTYSATAPLTALAKKMGFRGATMHGCNEIILNTGLSKNYEEVSAKAERFRLALTRSDDVVIEFEVAGKKTKLTLELGKQEAQKSHGLCRTPGEIANLPAGEIYWVPTDAHGLFPIKFKEDHTIALMEVALGRIINGTLLSGNQETLDTALARFRSDPATGVIGELGLGTQVLPPSGADIQDEKILGTLHVATGRDDHLGGNVGPSQFKDKKNATHEDILFAPHKTPEVRINGVWMHKDGVETLLIKDYEPTDFVKQVAL